MYMKLDRGLGPLRSSYPGVKSSSTSALLLPTIYAQPKRKQRDDFDRRTVQNHPSTTTKRFPGSIRLFPTPCAIDDTGQTENS